MFKLNKKKYVIILIKTIFLFFTSETLFFRKGISSLILPVWDFVVVAIFQVQKLKFYGFIYLFIYIKFFSIIFFLSIDKNQQNEFDRGRWCLHVPFEYLYSLTEQFLSLKYFKKSRTSLLSIITDVHLHGFIK